MSLSKSSTSDIVKKYGSNDKDTGSTAVQIALLSKRIEDLQKHFKDHKKDNHSRTGLLQIVSDRKKLLSYLKKKDPSSYEKIIKDLKLRD
ncbi:30S ribosomal protein S15 [Bacteroidota bacterium]|jgi:small subunit ribosomal protein S15|nr:30S ribosomal protein S15 [Gammaproteobacteria bacterium]MAO98933.1 30S ribosomal protein S15 [Gammaproteobacteria bacterium]MDA9716076.1 30S ribosomal protein S15 [Bacteroidota bacterium]MEC7859150.1 30S ribosomal protein S15 [Pseudomonadota bacterium]MEC8152752.1 30S ribosomal protein S15 [Pseudomonadota bacterium]|tara:strand:+ start:18872 stop:19141 length:270 start_codon:yes stop_codon:yes gene_type:complete